MSASMLRKQAMPGLAGRPATPKVAGLPKLAPRTVKLGAASPIKVQHRLTRSRSSIVCVRAACIAWGLRDRLSAWL